jgi:hypothetical protein
MREIRHSPISGVFRAPCLHAIHVLLAAEVLAVVGLAQPAPLARLLARRTACGFGTVFLAVAQARIAAEQFLAAQAQASSSSRFDHGASGPMGDRIMPGSPPSADAA